MRQTALTVMFTMNSRRKAKQMPFDPSKPYRLFARSKLPGSVQRWGAVSPSLLHFVSPVDGEIVADRWRASHPSQEFIVRPINPQGYIVETA
jgi:hypothetical protein